MIIEAAQLTGLAIVTDQGRGVGSVDRIIIDGKDIKISGFQVAKSGLVKKFSGLDYADVTSVSRQQLTIESVEALTKDLKKLDNLHRHYGRVFGVTAKTQSGKVIGKVVDLYVETATGGIIRFFIRNLWNERIIPSQFLIAITPKEIIFKDIVDQPIFNQVAAGNVPAALV